MLRVARKTCKAVTDLPAVVRECDYIRLLQLVLERTGGERELTAVMPTLNPGPDLFIVPCKKYYSNVYLRSESPLGVIVPLVLTAVHIIMYLRSATPSSVFVPLALNVFRHRRRDVGASTGTSLLKTRLVRAAWLLSSLRLDVNSLGVFVHIRLQALIP